MRHFVFRLLDALKREDNCEYVANAVDGLLGTTEFCISSQVALEGTMSSTGAPCRLCSALYDQG